MPKDSWIVSYKIADLLARCASTEIFQCPGSPNIVILLHDERNLFAWSIEPRRLRLAECAALESTKGLQRRSGCSKYDALSVPTVLCILMWLKNSLMPKLLQQYDELTVPETTISWVIGPGDSNQTEVGCGDGVRIAGHTHLPHGLHKHRNLGKKTNTFAGMRMTMTVSSFPLDQCGHLEKCINTHGIFWFFSTSKISQISRRRWRVEFSWNAWVGWSWEPWITVVSIEIPQHILVKRKALGLIWKG